MALSLRSLSSADWPAVRAIFEAGMATGHATLETESPSWENWDAGHCAVPRLVAVAGGAVAGWAALSPVSRRLVYRGVAELSVYVAPEQWGHGIGAALLRALIPAAEAADFWTLQATVLAENHASLALHQRVGFRVVGTRERIGMRNGVWRDSVVLERRSRVVG